MPPTIIVTVGTPEPLLAAAAFDALVELLELLQAARPAARAAMLAAAAILVRERLDIGLLLLCIRGCSELGVVSCEKVAGNGPDQAVATSAWDLGRQDSRRRSSRLIRYSAASATFEGVPRPSATVNGEPSTIRGIALAILM